MAARTIPKSRTLRDCARVNLRTCGRQRSRSKIAANPWRKKVVPSGPIAEKSSLPTAAPICTERIASSASTCDGTLYVTFCQRPGCSLRSLEFLIFFSSAFFALLGLKDELMDFPDSVCGYHHTGLRPRLRAHVRRGACPDHALNCCLA